MQVMQRVRYNFWQALADVGGFHDGLKLLVSLFIAPVSSILFENDLLKGKIFTGP